MFRGNNKVKKIVEIIRKEGLGGISVRIKMIIRKLFAKSFMKICRAITKSPNKIVCSNFAGKGYGDNPKYIVEELLARGNSYDIVWLVNKKDKYTFPSGIRCVQIGTFRELYELATAKVWIDNARKELCIYKAEDQFYIQTWHGFYPLKKMEKDALKSLSAGYIKCAKHDGAMTDLMISGCKIRTELYKNSFWYSGDVLECGTPRNDIFFKNVNMKTKVAKSLGISEEKKWVLYAPTFRDDYSMDAYTINYESLCVKLKEKFDGDWLCIIKLHPAIYHKKDMINYSSNVIDASSYSDIQELFIASDILISDYSDCLFEFSLTYKPAFIYAADLDEYMRGREFYYDIRTLHFPIAKNNDELMACIKEYSRENQVKDTNDFFNRIGSFETGSASKTVADKIESVIGGC